MDIIVMGTDLVRWEGIYIYTYCFRIEEIPGLGCKNVNVLSINRQRLLNPRHQILMNNTILLIHGRGLIPRHKFRLLESWRRVLNYFVGRSEEYITGTTAVFFQDAEFCGFERVERFVEGDVGFCV
jgi:hypothetical protein